MGGITWIEFYALYAIHAGNEDEEVKQKKDQLPQPTKLENQVVAFKKACKKVAEHTVKDDQAWRLATSTVMRNCPREAAVENRKAAIRGMPRISQEDGEQVITILMALRGPDKKKHPGEWKDGQLKVLPTNLNPHGSVQASRKAVRGGEKWNVPKLTTVTVPPLQHGFGFTWPSSAGDCDRISSVPPAEASDEDVASSGVKMKLKDIHCSTCN